MNLDKVHELNELSSDVEHNLPRMKQLAHELVEEMMQPQQEKKVEWYEYAHLRVCNMWLQKESCRQCLFEVLCNLNNKDGMSF